MSETGELRRIVARLRGPDGCPWDREQTPQSLRAALIEECYETVEALDLGDDANLREELGDLLLHIVMQAQMGQERGAFTFDDIAAGVSEKMIRRHPHVFAQSDAADSEQVLRQWEEIKRAEKGGESRSILQDIPRALPALMRAQMVQKKAARVGFDWDSSEPVFAKLDEEIAEIREAVAARDQAAIEDEVGDLLFTVVNLSRKLKVDAETSLTGAVTKFMRRFQAIEAVLAGEGRRIEDVPLAELDAIWERQKQTSLTA